MTVTELDGNSTTNISLVTMGHYDKNTAPAVLMFTTDDCSMDPARFQFEPSEEEFASYYSTDIDEQAAFFVGKEEGGQIKQFVVVSLGANMGTPKSVMVPAGYKLLVFPEDNFEGQKQEFVGELEDPASRQNSKLACQKIPNPSTHYGSIRILSA